VAAHCPTLAEDAVLQVGDVSATLALAVSRPLPTKLGEEPLGITPSADKAVVAAMCIGQIIVIA